MTLSALDYQQAFADGYDRYCSIVRAGYVFGQPRLAEHLASATDLTIKQSVRIIMAAAEDRSASGVTAAMVERQATEVLQ